MQLAVSNIAWTNQEEELIADKLVELGVKYVEIAPTKRWEDPAKVTDEEALEYKEWWQSRGLSVIAFQSLLFSRPDLKIFASDENRQETIEYIKRLIRLASVMGVKRLVFGSPKNRQRGALSIEDANKIAINFFSTLGDYARQNDVVLCLEPNATQYNCDFITNSTEGDALVRIVANEGFGLHLDTGCMELAGDILDDSIHRSSDILKHYHVSEPMLEPVDEYTRIDHASAATALKSINYRGIISIEMRPGERGENSDRVSRAVHFVQRIYKPQV